jgi:hypothetical protein
MSADSSSAFTGFSLKYPPPARRAQIGHDGSESRESGALTVFERSNDPVNRLTHLVGRLGGSQSLQFCYMFCQFSLLHTPKTYHRATNMKNYVTENKRKNCCDRIMK